jgi:hypothetical protein
LTSARPAINELERNKQTVTAFHDLMFNQWQPEEAITRYAGATYTQHNPAVADRKAPVAGPGLVAVEDHVLGRHRHLPPR